MECQFPSRESERSIKYVTGVSEFSCFNDFTIGIWNCSYSVVLSIFFSFYLIKLFARSLSKIGLQKKYTIWHRVEYNIRKYPTPAGTIYIVIVRGLPS